MASGVPVAAFPVTGPRDVVAHLMTLDQAYYTSAHTGDLMARCTNDVQRVRELCGPATMEIIRAFTMMIAGFLA